MNSGRTILAGLTMILAASAVACAGSSAPKAAVANESPSAGGRDYGPSDTYYGLGFRPVLASGE